MDQAVRDHGQLRYAIPARSFTTTFDPVTALPGLGKAVKKKANFDVAPGVSALGSCARSQEGAAFPLRFVDRAAYLGPFKVMDIFRGAGEHTAVRFPTRNAIRGSVTDRFFLSVVGSGLQKVLRQSRPTGEDE
jgi:hypothetical protein